MKTSTACQRRNMRRWCGRLAGRGGLGCCLCNVHKALYNKACCYALLDQPEAALNFLQQAIALAPDKYIELAKTDPDFTALRSDPRFQALIQ
ncbi:MAG: tetratricopeptide repeat protein [Leptolyngbyaceae cyanobacterium SL_1_1]|nr:tetratricopeptide repeat protein [Leptolyngbyaceae cyanobacterium RM1_1_2]NJO10027.1 tetratricopeptide repeat protein [Leptolyngbyaceae cyanobacterium SL_1_1]